MEDGRGKMPPVQRGGKYHPYTSEKLKNKRWGCQFLCAE
jgi:hypothetical protein